MITHSPKKVFNLLDKSNLDKVQTIQNPIVKVDVGDGSAPITIGGDICIVHYNRDKEIAHSTQKLQKRFRHLRKQEKQARCCSLGETFPNVTLLNKAGEHKG
jgi:hypothetical protein